MSLKRVIQGLQSELKTMVEAREEALSSSRKVITLSKQAVMAVHRGKVEAANERLEDAEKILNQVKEVLPSAFELKIGSINPAYQEYAEAQTLLRLVTDGSFPSPKELDVPIIPYLLGLGDLVGELRRRAVDSLRSGDLRTSDKCLETMEEIYIQLLSLEEAHSLTPLLRRKCDVARRLIEVTRGEIVTAVGRRSLEEAIVRLEKAIERGG